MASPETLQTAAASATSDARDLAALSAAIVEELRHTCQVPWAEVRLSEATAATTGMPASPPCPPEYAPWIQAVLDQGEPLHLDVSQCTMQAPVFFAGQPIRNRQGRLLGVVGIGAPEARPFDAGRQRRLELAARHLSAEIELLEIRDRPGPFQVFIDSMPAIFYVIDEQGRLLRWNQRLVELTGRDPESLPDLDPSALFALEHRASANSLHQQALATGRAQGEVRLRGADALSRPHLLTCQRLELAEGTRVVSMGLDISPLAESEARYRSLVQSARDAIVVLRPDGFIESVDGAFREITDWEPAEWVGRSLAELVHPPDLPRALRALDELGREERMPLFEIRVRSRNGDPVPLEVQGTQVPLDADTVGALVIARDIRERKAMDQRLHRIQRLDAIGQLAAGVAHDFNNLLQVIHGEVDLLLAHPMLTPSAQESLQNVEEASSRAQRLARKLLLLGREQAWQAERLDINALIARFLPMLQRLLGQSHELRWQPAAALPSIQGDFGMLEQVLMNLVLNARDAMPEGGTVTLSTAELTIDSERAARDPDARPGDFVELAVADTGVGISPEHLPRIFEPLFTTKPVGSGTGLGLATLYSIVRRHEGWVDVDSSPGEGARFLLYFPVAAPA